MKWFTKKQEEVLDIPGKVSFENGTFSVYDPAGNGSFATIGIPKDEKLSLYINGEKKEGKQTVSEKDIITYSYHGNILQHPTYHVSLQIVNQKMEVKLTKETLPGEEYLLEDMPLSEHIELRLTRKLFYTCEVPKEEIETLLQEKGITSPMLEEGYQELCAASERKFQTTIAKGLHPIPGIPSRYELLYEQNEINMVISGTEIAKFVEAVPPVPGKNVFGKEVVPKLKEQLQELGEGVSREGHILYAERDGRLHYELKKIDVYPQIIIPRDLNASDGYVLINDADVTVQGAVLEGCVLRTSGRVIVEKGIHASTVIADGDVFVKGNIERSSVYCGFKLSSYRLLRDEVKKLTKQLKQIVHKIEALYPEDKEYYDKLQEDIKRQMQLIKEYQNPSWEEHVEYVIEHGEQELVEVTQSFLRLQQELKQKFSVRGYHKEERMLFYKYIGQFQIIRSQVEPLCTDTESSLETESVTTSTLYVSGVIKVKGPGVYMSEMHAGDRIYVDNNATGGNIIAKNYVKVGQYKSFNTNDFRIEVWNQEGKIDVTLRYPDTCLVIGGKKDISYEMQQNVSLKLNRSEWIDEENEENLNY